MVNDTYPNDLPSVIAYLDTRFPARCARVGMTVEQIWIEAGARSVVDHLKIMLEEVLDANKILTTSTIKKS